MKCKFCTNIGQGMTASRSRGIVIKIGQVYTLEEKLDIGILGDLWYKVDL